MYKINLRNVAFTLIIFIMPFELWAQTRTVGLFNDDTALVYKGYTLMAPMQNMSTYLFNNDGRVVHKWSKSIYPPGRSVFLLANGNLLRTCSIRNDSVNTGGGDGGRVEEYTWNDSLIWSFSYSTTNYTAHHDIKLLPNGNILLLAVEKKTISQMLEAGFDTSRFQSDIRTKGYILPDYIIEVKPTYPTGGNIVWE